MIRLIIAVYLLINFLSAENISINIPGLAKVGNNCFLSVMLKDDSKYKFDNLEISIFLTDHFGSLMGDAKVSLLKLNKNLAYNTSVPISLKKENNCKRIKQVEIYMNRCSLSNKEKISSCNSILSVKNNDQASPLKVKILENKYFYNVENSKDYLISELGITLKNLNSKLLKKYGIKEEKSGMVIVKRTNNLFEEGDLILELEMNTINNIKEIRNIIKEVKSEKKKSIFVNYVRNNKKKLIAAYLK